MYLFAVPLSNIALCLAVFRYLFKRRFSEVVYSSLDLVFGTERQALGKKFTQIIFIRHLIVDKMKIDIWWLQFRLQDYFSL